MRLNDPLGMLQESAVDRRADFDSLVEVDGRHGTLADTFRGEFEFLPPVVSSA